VISVVKTDFSDGENLRRSDVVNWYLKQIESEIESEEELAQKKFLLDKVLDRLIDHVSSVISLRLQKLK
jgi:DNA replication licensing factor MCM6